MNIHRVFDRALRSSLVCSLCATAAILPGCVHTQVRPTPAATAPTPVAHFGSPSDGSGRVLVDVTDGTAIVERADTDVRDWPAERHVLCATPCELWLPHGRHELRLVLPGEAGSSVSVDSLVVESTDVPTVFRRSMTREELQPRGAARRATAAVLSGISVLLISFGSGMLAVKGEDGNLAGGILAGTGLVLPFIAFPLGRRAVIRYEGSERSFPLEAESPAP